MPRAPRALLRQFIERGPGTPTRRDLLREFLERNPPPSQPAFLSGHTIGSGEAFGTLTVGRYQDLVGTDVRAETGWYVTGMGVGGMLAAAMAGIVHQPRDAWALIGAALGFLWSRRHWRKS
jgi:hypothetical protein